MNGYYLATNLLALAATVTFIVLALIGDMSWGLAILGSVSVNLVAAYYTKDEVTPS